MDAFGVLENSYYVINRNTENMLSSQNKMLNYSVSAIYTATAVLIEVLNRNRIIYTELQVEELCRGFSNMKKDEIALADKSETDLDEILFGLLTDGIDLKSRKRSGSERTPDEIIKYMLDIIEYDENISVSKSIVDPSCGTGTFVKQILERFINGLYETKTTDMFMEKLIKQRLIRAYDTKPSNIYVTKIVMICTLINHKLLNEMDDILEMINKLPICCEDFLTVNEKTDFVIGNPPYVRLQNLPVTYRDFIKENFVSATGRFDIFICFMEKSDQILNHNGRMCLITSNKYLTANYGLGIRKYLSSNGHVRKLIDLYDTKFFCASVLPAIIMCENNNLKNQEVDYTGIKSSSQKPQYHYSDLNELFCHLENRVKNSKSIVCYGDSDENTFEIFHSKVKIPSDGKTWNFSSYDENVIKLKMDEQKMCSLKDIFDVCVGIKTTADSVFVKPMTEKFIQERGFEKNVIYPLIQSFDISKWNVSWGQNAKDRYILYPHREVGGDMIAIPLDEVIKGDVSIKDDPDKVLPIEIIDERVTDKLIGKMLDIKLSTKQRGQQLERMVA